jgi:serine/threonine-protein kinase RsbW
MTARVELRLEGEMDHLRLAWQAGETILSDVPFKTDPTGARYNILLAMQELLTNVFRHGYRNEAAPVVEVRFESNEHEFTFEIRDRAPRFDPTHGPQEPEDEEMPTEGGGYGLVIVNSVMDSLEYRFVDGWNVLLATKMVGSSVAVGATEESS